MQTEQQGIIIRNQTLPNEMNKAYYLNTEIESHTQVNQPDMTTTQDFYKNYSPKKFKLRPRDDIYLDLKMHIKQKFHKNIWNKKKPSYCIHVFTWTKEYRYY